jgi:hypothetical protein
MPSFYTHLTFIVCALAGHTEIVRTLLGMTDKGVRVNARGPHNYTALHAGE